MTTDTTHAPPNKESVNQIVTDIFAQKSPEILDSRSDKIRDFVATTINGDVSKSHVVTRANLSKDRKGVLIYVLTNLRIIKIEIDSTDMQSQSFPLSKIISVSRKTDGDRSEVQVSFENDSFGLRYNQAEATITDFFQKVDQSRVKVSP